MTIWQRLDYLVDPGTWCPLHTLYNPEDNEEGTTNVFDGLGKISGKWAVIIGFDNKVLAGAWVPGQAENILRVTDLSKRLNLPLVWLVNCSGVKLHRAGKILCQPARFGGTTFFRHAELEQMGIPVLAGIYGTNPAGGGYQGISPTILFAHKDCNIAVGRRRHPERHVSQGLLRCGRRRTADRGRQTIQGRTARLGQRSTMMKPVFSDMFTRRRPGCWTASRST